MTKEYEIVKKKVLKGTKRAIDKIVEENEQSRKKAIAQKSSKSKK